MSDKWQADAMSEFDEAAERALGELELDRRDAVDEMLEQEASDDLIHARLNQITAEGMSKLIDELIGSAMDEAVDMLVRSGLGEEEIADLTQRAYLEAEALRASIHAKIKTKWGHLGRPVH